MSTMSFTTWLQDELTYAKQALLASYVKRDQLLYQESPALHTEYLQQFGTLEETVLKSELTTRLLERKIDLIQIAINQQKTINLEAIEKQLQIEKQQLLQELEATSTLATTTPNLSEPERQELQSKYRAIVQDYHPQVHTGLNQTLKALYEQAQEAYKNQNIEALNLVYDMLYDSVDMHLSLVKYEANTTTPMDITADYTLTAQVYKVFTQTTTDVMLLQASQRITEQQNQVNSEITHILHSFPFTARETLQNPEKTKAYLTELGTRQYVSEEAQKANTVKIQKLLKEYNHGK